jgi:acetoin:2,6-dichlorophenolindophenol oxidoreductase subunit alpha
VEPQHPVQDHTAPSTGNREGAVQLSREELLKAYRAMATIRRFEERVQDEFSKGGIPGFVHLYAGEEASAVGVCANLRDDDYIASTHRGHGHSIAKGCDPVLMMQELFAKKGGLCGGKGGSMHIADLDRGMLGANGIVGGGPPLVVGAALSAKTLGRDSVAVSFTGDGGSNQGTTFEAMNLAVVLKLPAIFVFENNQYGEGTGVAYHVGSHDIAGRAGGFGLPAVKVDGDDFFAVHEAAEEAVARARSGGGPSAIEVDTCRFYGHHSGDAQLYRGKDEVRRLRDERDCLKHFRRRVGEAALLDPSALDAVEAEVAALIDRAVETARTAVPPAEADLLTDVYVSY